MRKIFEDYILLILNNDLTELNQSSKDALKWLCENATKIYAADGGANLLYETSRNFNLISIIGDLDSIEPHILSFYKSNGAEISKSLDQNSTDFFKSLFHIRKKEISIKTKSVLVFSYSDGPLYQTLSNLNSLLKNHNSFKSLALINHKEYSIIIPPQNKFKIEIDSDFHEGNCGYFPLEGNSLVSTDGFKWNLNEQIVKFGVLVSSSNLIDSTTVLRENGEEFVTISSSANLVFNSKIKSDFWMNCSK